jgi:hypothetical protein
MQKHVYFARGSQPTDSGYSNQVSLFDAKMGWKGVASNSTTVFPQKIIVISYEDQIVWMCRNPEPFNTFSKSLQSPPLIGEKITKDHTHYSCVI